MVRPRLRRRRSRPIVLMCFSFVNCLQLTTTGESMSDPGHDLVGDKTHLGNEWYPRVVRQIEGIMIGDGRIGLCGTG